MPISNQGQLDLSTIEQVLGFQDAEAAATRGAVVPEVAQDPGDPYRSVTQLKVTSTSDLDSSRVTYTVVDDQDEVWLEFDVRYTHPALSSANSLTLLRLLDASSNPVVELVRSTDSVTRWKPLGATQPSSFDFSSGIAKNAWERIRLHYKKPTTGTNGVVEAWRYNGGTSSYDQILNINNHNVNLAVRKVVLMCAPGDALSATSGDKIVWFRAVTWGLQQSQVGFKHRGLQRGHVCSSGSTATTIDAQLWYRFPRAYFGTQLGGSSDPTDLTVQFQFMLATASSWSNAGSTINFIPDGQNEMIATGTATGLSPLTNYLFRAVVVDNSSGSSFTITTETTTCTTPSAAAGSAGSLKYAFGSCCNQGPASPSPTPHTVLTAIRNQGVHGFIHLGDMMYGSFINKEEAEDFLRSKYRQNQLFDFDENRLHESAAFFPMWDDHECGADNAYPSNPALSEVFPQANAAADAYWVNRRINSIAGGKGWWFDTAKCRFIMMDTRSARNPTGTSPTMLGTTQFNAVKAKLANTAKPIRSYP